MTIAVSDDFPFDTPDSITDTVLLGLPRCAHYHEKPETIMNYTCTPDAVQGQYVVVYVNNSMNEALVLCEVEVYGTPMPGLIF